jgi:dephospho-CoA kinase
MARERWDIGFAGKYGVGKTTSANIAANLRGFAVFTGSEYLTELAIKKKVTLSERADYDKFYRRMRAELGPDFIATAGLNLHLYRVAHDGLRNRADIDTFIGAGGILVGIVCDDEKRFKRTAGTSPKYPTTREEFLATDLLENSDSPSGIHVDYALSQAAYTIDNSGSPADLTQNVLRVIDAASGVAS